MQTNVVHGADASSLAPALPAEGGMAARRWDCAEKLASVTNDVTCWALYEAVPGSEKAPSTSIASKSVVDRTTPCSLDEYFRLYDNLAWSDEFSGSTLSVGSGANWGYETDERNRELQRYTTTDSNHIVSDGTLKLQARRESKDGRSFTSGAGYFGSHLAGEVVFGILATQDLSDWTAASLIPMKKFSADSLWKPIASESSTYVFPARMFFKYTIDLGQ
ncbi:MAG: hypothetical protein IJI73_06335 [Kiritimatiellae bacterium]|nr:hypothetical protein [Kiritimatiellia bacterium]